MERNRQRAAVVALTVAYAVAFGCGGGGDDNPVTPTTCVSFAPAADPGQTSQVTTAVGASACSTVTVVVRAENVADVFGFYFDVVYDPNVVQFDDAAFNGGSTSYLNSGPGDVACFAGDANNSGRVIAGCTLLGGSGIDYPALPSEMMRLPFKKRAQSGSSTFRFENNKFEDTPGNNIPGVTWSDGGTFTIR